MGERLSALDAAYLAGYRSEYLSGVRLLVFPGPPPGYEAFVEHVRERVRDVPRLRERVRRGRFEVRPPRWEEDPEFSVERHVRLMELTATGDAVLERLSEDLLAMPMDLHRPLWDLTYVEGLPDDRFAAALRFHHALGDGVSNTRLMTGLFPPVAGADELAFAAAPPQADRRADASPDAGRRDRRGSGAAALGQLRRRLTVVHPRRVRRQLRRGARRLGVQLALARRPAPRSGPLFSGPMSQHRSVALLSLPLDEMRAARSSLGATVNTLIVGALAGAFRRHFARVGESPTEITASIAVSVRAAGDTTFGNRVRAFSCRLPTLEPDPRERLRVLAESLAKGVAATRAAGEQREIIGPQAWRNFLLRHRFHEPPFDMVLTNAGGPASALRYGDRLAELVLPSGPNTSFRGPLIRVSRYLDSVIVAITTDPTQRVDGRALAIDLRDSLAELLALAGDGPAAGGRPLAGAWVANPWRQPLAAE